MGNLLNRDGGKSDELGFARWLKQAFGQGILNTRTTTSWKVTQRGAGANMSVDVAAGDGFITINEYEHVGFSDTTTNITITTADPANPRIDTIVAYVNRAIVSNAVNNNPGALLFLAVAGTPAGSPTAPNGATIQTAIGASNVYIVLANVAVAAATSNIVNANITDTRVPIAFAGKLYGGSSNTVGHIIPNVADDTLALLAAVQTLTNKTLTSPTITNPIISGDLGWQTGASIPTTIVANGNHSYTLTHSASILATKQPGMRNKYTRTVTAPTQSTSLNGTTQYYSKAAPAGMTFTNNFVVSVWVKITSYAAQGTVASRYNGTSGWSLRFNSAGQLNLFGFNAGGTNYSLVQSAQSTPLNKWVHAAAQLDMATFTATTTTSYVMSDGVDVPATVGRVGTNPTALIQAGNLEIGSENGGTGLFPGKIAQVAVYSAKVTQATILASMNQTLVGTETSLISAYSFNNTINDLNTTNANNLTANGGAVATNLDTPFTQTVSGITAGTTNYSITTSISSNGLTETVQVPEGDTLPTSGGISAVSYSTQKVPYGFPAQRSKWRILSIYRVTGLSSASTTFTNVGSRQVIAPIGEWAAGWKAAIYADRGAENQGAEATLSTSTTAETEGELTQSGSWSSSVVMSVFLQFPMSVSNVPITATTATTYYMLVRLTSAASGSYGYNSTTNSHVISLENAYL